MLGDAIASKKSQSQNRNMHKTCCGKMSWVKSNKLLPDMKRCDTTLEQEFEIKILHKSPLEKV